jgi:hypothetical protein
MQQGSGNQVIPIQGAPQDTYIPDQYRTIINKEQKSSRPYSIRVTTGSHTSAGWEKNLTDGDPNLRHWTWMPVTSYDQGYIRTPAGQDQNGRSLLKRPPGHIYIKPQTMPLPRRVYHFADPTPRRSVADLSGSVRLPNNKPSAPEPAQTAERKVATYSDISGRLMAPKYSAPPSESKAVHGRLLHPGN